MLEFILPGISNQLHLLGRPGPSGESPTNQGATDIRRVYQQFRFRQVYLNYFSDIFCSTLLWISPPSVEILTTGRPALVVLEEFHLAQPLGGFFTRLARTA